MSPLDNPWPWLAGTSQTDYATNFVSNRLYSTTHFFNDTDNRTYHWKKSYGKFRSLPPPTKKIDM